MNGTNLGSDVVSDVAGLKTDTVTVVSTASGVSGL